MPWSTEAAADTPAAPAAVWALYEDVPGWARWDHAVADARLDGPLAAAGAGSRTRPHAAA